jgi:hypothetical protein
MLLTLERHAYLSDRTMGKLYVGDEIFHTLERPWIRSPYHLGGTNFESCVPDGRYILQPFDSEAHPDCWNLYSPNLDVFLEEPNDGAGRWAILIHAGNYVKDVVGCIAPGLTADEEHVWNSRAAMDRIRSVLGAEEHTLEIKPVGATN